MGDDGGGEAVGFRRLDGVVDGEGGAQEVVGFGVGPVTQAAVGVGFTQFAAWVDGVFGARARHRRPELHIAAFGLEVLIVEAAHQPWRFNGRGWGADRDAQVPGGKVDHGVGLFTEGVGIGPKGLPGSL